MTDDDGESPNEAGGRYIMLLSIHGLVRGHDMELGRDADTGGQVLYVVELARALARHPDVARVDLLTRLIRDDNVDNDYAEPQEELAPEARIIRIPCGPDRYLRKESLWPHLDGFMDNVLTHIRDAGRVPDLIHGHYADAGYVAARLAGLLDVPMVFTGHSLGRVKRERLLEKGQKPESIERRYRISQRIEAEEIALDNAAFVVASTRQEIDEQYATYDNYQPQQMVPIPPGVDLSRFSPPERKRGSSPPIEAQMHRFLRKPDKPIVLAICRPDPRKNIPALIKAYGENEKLREMANLVLVAGNRDNLKTAEKGVRAFFTEAMALIDYYDLHGHVAYPKHHSAEDVPELYRLAARSRGVFVNCALTEPFGLTLLEAAASGLPIIAPEDGGPRDILSACNNGVLIDPHDHDAIGQAILSAISNRRQWQQWSRAGLRGAQRNFSWQAHVNKYMKTAKTTMRRRDRIQSPFSVKTRLVAPDRLVIADLDETLTGDREALRRLLESLQQARKRIAFGIATGRSLELTVQALKQWRIPTPTVLITSVGTAIHYGPQQSPDTGWQRHIQYRWRPERARAALDDMPGLELQGPEGQTPFKISYFMDRDNPPDIREVRARLRRQRAQARVITSHQAYLDVIPLRASKGAALRFFLMKWNIPAERCLIAGDAANDEELLRGNALSVVMGEQRKELSEWSDDPRVYFPESEHAWGLIEGLDHYHFLDAHDDNRIGETAYA